MRVGTGRKAARRAVRIAKSAGKNASDKP
jgi:hypothetical protein